MTKYLIKWEDSVWYNLEIEADSVGDALDKFGTGDYNDFIDCVGSEMIPDTIEVEEIND
jgi:hypothetical protein